MPQHRDRHADGNRHLGHPQRQAGQPGPFDSGDARDSQDHHDADSQHRGRRGDPQQLTADVVAGATQPEQQGDGRGDQPDRDQHPAHRQQGCSERAGAVSLAVDEVARRRRERSEGVQHQPGQRDPDRPSPAGRQEVPVWCEKEDQHQRGEGRPSEQRPRPQRHVSPGIWTRTAPVEHPDAVRLGRQRHREQAGHAQEPAERVPGMARDDESAHEGAAQVGHRSQRPPVLRPRGLAQQGPVRRGEDGVQDGGEHGEGEHGPGCSYEHVRPPRGTRAP